MEKGEGKIETEKSALVSQYTEIMNKKKFEEYQEASGHIWARFRFLLFSIIFGS